MNLLNQIVIHKKFGNGTVTEQNSTQIVVEFVDRSIKFKYPDAFKQFLICGEPSLQDELLQEIATLETIKAEQLAKKDIPVQPKIEESQKSVSSSVKTKKERLTSPRVEGKRMTFYVFQGDTYITECRDGYLWAPLKNRAGLSLHHWERLTDVRPGDVIFHGCNAHIAAISFARSNAYECPQPTGLSSEDLWEKNGRRVDCDYTPLEIPIKTSTLLDDILQWCKVKYAPFDKDGNGNMGYLFELNINLAKVFLDAAIKENPYLLELTFVNDLLSDPETN